MKMKNGNALTREARRQDVSVLTLIRRALADTNGNVREAAKQLGCTTPAIYYHIKQSGASLSRVIVREPVKP